METMTKTLKIKEEHAYFYEELACHDSVQEFLSQYKYETDSELLDILEDEFNLDKPYIWGIINDWYQNLAPHIEIFTIFDTDLESDAYSTKDKGYLHILYLGDREYVLAYTNLPIELI